jgi:hypothetical protein
MAMAALKISLCRPVAIINVPSPPSRCKAMSVQRGRSVASRHEGKKKAKALQGCGIFESVESAFSASSDYMLSWESADWSGDGVVRAVCYLVVTTDGV